jgi:hypothetical protein
MENCETFDWAKAIEINRDALTRIVAEIFALLGLVAGGTVERLPYVLYLAAERLLRPAESALRRLIVIAARGLVLKPIHKRAMPKGLKIESKAAGRMAFRLFDQRKRFDFIEHGNPLIVMVKTYTDNPFNLFNSFNRSRQAQKKGGPNSVILCRRLAALAHALENLTSQAKRMARWQARRKLMVKPKFTCALRPGRAPGHRKKPSHDVDFVLKECHWLAWDALRVNTS